MEQGWPGLAQYTPAIPADWSPLPRTVQDALDQLGGRAGAASGAAASFVLRPGGTAGPGTFTTWASLVTALDTLDIATFKTVAVDDSLAPAHITAGAWSIENVQFVPGGADAVNGAIPQIIVDDGAQFLNTHHLWFEGVNVLYNGVAAGSTLITTPAGSNLSLVFDRSTAFSAGLGGAGLVNVGAGSVLSITSRVSFLSGQLVIGAATGEVAYLGFDGATLAPNVINMTPGATVNLVSDGSTTTSWTQTPAASSALVLDPTPTFLFQPGGTAVGNTYTTWATLAAAMAQCPGVKTILVDDSLAAAHVTTGTTNVEQCSFVAAADIFTSSTLIFDAGAKWTFTKYLRLEGALTLTATDVAAFALTVAGGTFPTMYMGIDSVVQAGAGAKPWADVSGLLNIILDGGTLGDGVHNAIQIENGGTLFAAVSTTNGSSAIVTAHAIKGGAGATFDAALGLGGIISAQADFSGTLTPSFLGTAVQVGYTPATAGNWNPNPIQVKAALDQVAASNSVTATGNIGTGGGTVTVVTGNITKAKNGKMGVSASCLLSTSASASTLTVQLKRDAANIGNAKTLVVPATGIPTGIDVNIDFEDTAPDTAAHTYTLSVSVSAGTLTVAANSAQIKVVEDS